MDTAIAVKKIRMRKKDILAFAVAFALGLSPLTAGVYPFGLSLMIASAKHRIYILLGCLTSVFFTGENILLPSLILLFSFFGIRAFDKDKPCPLFLRLIFAVGSSILLCVKIAVGGISLFSDGVMLVATAVSIPVFTLLFSAYFESGKVFLPKALQDCSLAAFAFAGTRFFGLVTVFGLPLSLAAGAVFTLVAAKTKGFLFGGVCGFVCGIACGVPAIAALGILGITFGLLVNNSLFLASLFSLMLAVSGYAYLAEARDFLPSTALLLSSVIIFIPLTKLLPQSCAEIMPSAIYGGKDIKLKKFAAVLSSLSGVFYTVSDTVAAESITNTSEKVHREVASYCDSCNSCSLDRNDFCNNLTTQLRCKGSASTERLPLHIKQGCSNAERIVRSVNRLTLLKEEECEKGLKAMAEEYHSFSSLLNNAAVRQEETGYDDRQLARELKQVLLQNKVTCDRVRVTGRRQKTVEVFGVKPDKMGVSSNRLSAAMSETARCRLSLPEFVINDEYVIMRINTLPRLNVEYAKTTLAKNGEPVCGDTVSFFESEDKYFYCLLSDGMGSGRDAALTSRLSAIMLEKLLTIGADKKDALQMVNKMLTQKKEEVFATIDLFEADRITAQATLMKVGAAPTFLIRDGECHRIEAKTPPAGIMREVIAERICLTLRKGDFIVMVSDGVVQTDSELFEFEPIIKSGGCKNAHSLAAKILEEAKSRAECADDMSVCVMRFY